MGGIKDTDDGWFFAKAKASAAKAAAKDAESVSQEDRPAWENKMFVGGTVLVFQFHIYWVSRMMKNIRRRLA